MKYHNPPKTPKMNEAQAEECILKESSLYQEFMAQREEILKHKWIKSEEAHGDIGFEAALVDWIVNHQAEWQKNRESKN